MRPRYRPEGTYGKHNVLPEMNKLSGQPDMFYLLNVVPGRRGQLL